MIIVSTLDSLTQNNLRLILEVVLNMEKECLNNVTLALESLNISKFTITNKTKKNTIIMQRQQSIVWVILKLLSIWLVNSNCTQYTQTYLQKTSRSAMTVCAPLAYFLWTVQVLLPHWHLRPTPGRTGNIHILINTLIKLI